MERRKALASGEGREAWLLGTLQILCTGPLVKSIVQMRTLSLREVKQFTGCHPALGFGFGPDLKPSRVSAYTPAAPWKCQQQPARWKFEQSSDTSFLQLRI